MKASTRALAGMVAIDAFLLAGAAYMVLQVENGAWTTSDPGGAISEITTMAGTAIGAITGLLIVVFIVQKRRGN